MRKEINRNKLVFMKLILKVKCLQNMIMDQPPYHWACSIYGLCYTF